MHIYSRIVDVDKELCNIVVPDAYQDDVPVSRYEIHFNDPNYVGFSVQAIHTAGLHIQDTKITAYKTVADEFFTTGQHVRFFFYLKGNTNVENGAGNQNYNHDVGMLQRNFLDDSGGGGIVHIHENDETMHVIIKMSRDFYIHLLQGENWIGDDSFHQYILSGEPENRPNQTFYIDLKMLRILQDILAGADMENNAYHFLKLKLRELLFSIHQLTNFGPSIPRKDSTVSSLDNLEKIRAYLSLHLDNPPSLVELSRKFMINEKKLKQDFKRTYGSTIYAFVIQARMEKAKKLLMEDHNVNELSVLLGYQSVSHFIKVFKSYHGYTPKEALKQFKAISMNTGKRLPFITSSSLFFPFLYEQLLLL